MILQQVTFAAHRGRMPTVGAGHDAPGAAAARYCRIRATEPSGPRRPVEPPQGRTPAIRDLAGASASRRGGREGPSGTPAGPASASPAVGS